MQSSVGLVRKKKEGRKEKGLRGFPFHLACSTNRLDIVKQHPLEDEDYPINDKYGDTEETTLMLACYKGHLDIVRTLCE